MCDALVNTCGADATARSTCTTAQSAASRVESTDKLPMTGASADAFNAAFGIITNYANVTPLDDQGDPFPSVDPYLPASFGKCSTPEIIFGAGFEGMKETAFEPADQSL